MSEESIKITAKSLGVSLGFTFTISSRVLTNLNPLNPVNLIVLSSAETPITDTEYPRLLNILKI